MALLDEGEEFMSIPVEVNDYTRTQLNQRTEAAFMMSLLMRQNN